VASGSASAYLSPADTTLRRPLKTSTQVPLIQFTAIATTHCEMAGGGSLAAPEICGTDNRLLARVTSPPRTSQLSPECEVANTPLNGITCCAVNPSGTSDTYRSMKSTSNDATGFRKVAGRSAAGRSTLFTKAPSSSAVSGSSIIVLWLGKME